MYDLLLKQAKTVDGQLIDIAITNDKISDIGTLNTKAKKVIDLAGRYYISAGWIDAHTHCFAKSPIYYDDPNIIGVESAVTTVVDAGSVGANDIDVFHQITKQALTHVYAFLNISKIGLIRQNELADLNDIDENAFKTALAKYQDFIIGIKVRMSKSVVGDNGLQPLLIAKKWKKQINLPLMVHIGNTPPNLDDIANQLTKGDIITHCFNGKPNKIFDEHNQLRDSIQQAIKRGVILDIGHGGESFSFAVAEKAKSISLYPNTISTDIYHKNRIHGPVYNLANVMTKFLCLDYSKQRIIDSVTKNAAQILNLPNKGELAIGFDADLTLFDIRDHSVTLSDSEGETRQSKEQFIPIAAIINDQVTITKEGKEDGFHL